MKKRIPAFFDYMNVQQQIDWEERLICCNAWGHDTSKLSGIYSYVCDYYNIPFLSYKFCGSFENACEQAIKDIKAKEDTKEPPFTYMFIDESQDFKKSFSDLCELITEKQVYVAGDVFQTIYDDVIDDGHNESDFLLSRCYRTDSRTFMIAQALGMGLFEKNKIQWPSDKLWNVLGYMIKKMTINIP